jgi:glyoxylase-like metal-dependent hydrolase (beta-lactamase superfamily II)
VCGGADGVLMIDDQFAPLSDKIKAAIAALDPHPIRFLVNTHRHGDHTGGNENFANLGVTIFAHDNVRKRMSADQVNPFSGDTTKASPAKALPLVTFNDSLTFHVNGQTITLFHVAPAHTDGDVVVWFRDRNVVHAGDCLFNGRYPVIDYAAGGSLEGMIAASERLLAAFGPDTKFIPGHGPLATRADVQALHDMLVTVRGRLLPLIAQKKSVAETRPRSRSPTSTRSGARARAPRTRSSRGSCPAWRRQGSDAGFVGGRDSLFPLKRDARGPRSQRSAGAGRCVPVCVTPYVAPRRASDAEPVPRPARARDGCRRAPFPRA